MKKHKRALSLLLIICIMCCAFFGSVESAHAVLPALLANPYFLGLCGTILCAAGLSFVDTSAMEAAVSSWFGSGMVAQAQQDALEAASMEWLSGNISSFTITTDLVDSIKGWLSGVTAAGGGSVSVGNGVFIDGVDYSYLPLIDYEAFRADSSNCGLITLSSLAQYGTFYPSTNGVSAHYIVNLPFFNVDSNSSVSAVYIYTNSGKLIDDGQFINILKDGSFKWVVDPRPVSLGLSIVDGAIVLLYKTLFSSSYFFISSSSYSVGTSIPFDSTWSPDSADKSKALVPGASLKLPKGLVNDGAIDSDFVGAMNPESVRVGTSDIPDVIAGTGTITGTGEGTGIFEGIGSLVLDIPLVGTIASTLSGILEAIKGFFDVSSFDLNFDSLKIGLTKVFPFCIPFDFFNAIKMFKSDASAFVFDINLETEYFTIDHTVDLTPFRLPILFFRYVVVFWFGFILISRTKDFMKW